VAIAYRAEAEEVVRVDAPQTGAGPYTAMAVFDGRRWAALCPQLDIASVGDTGEAAVGNLVAAVKEAIEVAQEEGLEPGRETPESEIVAFARSHQGPAPASLTAFDL
jgi:predicted RNase H-like HicB family nuclease